jgi:hypothetical protein
MPQNFPVPMPFPKDRSRVEVSTDDLKFDRDYWNDRRVYPIAGIDMFNRFLHDYDLIGMSRKRVSELLLGGVSNQREFDKQDLVSFVFPRVGCTPWAFGVKINVKDDRAVSWCFFEGDPMVGNFKESKPVSTNVVLKRPIVRGRILIARIGEEGSNAGAFPEVEPKDKGFSSQEWKDEISKGGVGVDRRKQGYKLLRDYDLVGMTSDQTVALLGTGHLLSEEPYIVFYDVFSGDCGNAGSDNLELWFENGIVEKWRVARHEVPPYRGPSKSWIRTKDEKTQFLQYCSRKW